MFQFLLKRAFQRYHFLKLKRLGWVGKKNLPSLRLTALTSCTSAKDRPTPSYKNTKLVFLLNPLNKSVYVVRSLHYGSYASHPSNTLLYLNLGDCLMSGGVQTMVCSWQRYFIGKRKNYIKRTSPILELASKICGSS